MLAPMAHVPRAVAGQVAGLSVALCDGTEAATVVLSRPAELLTEAECIEAAALFLEAAERLQTARLQAQG